MLSNFFNKHVDPYQFDFNVIIKGVDFLSGIGICLIRCTALTTNNSKVKLRKDWYEVSKNQTIEQNLYFNQKNFTNQFKILLGQPSKKRSLNRLEEIFFSYRRCKNWFYSFIVVTNKNRFLLKLLREKRQFNPCI